MKAYKGFDENLKCRDFQYEIGKEYKEDSAEICEKGFHACEHPLDVFSYYPPSKSRFCEVEIDDNGQRVSSDSKVCGTQIKIGAEIGIPGIVKAAVEYVKSHTTTEYTDPEKATAGYKGAATAGNCGAATSRGSSASGKNGLSIARGNNVKVKGGLGAVLVIAEENRDNYDVKDWASAIVDGKKIKADTWYKLENGKFVETE